MGCIFLRLLRLIFCVRKQKQNKKNNRQWNSKYKKVLSIITRDHWIEGQHTILRMRISTKLVCFTLIVFQLRLFCDAQSFMGHRNFMGHPIAYKQRTKPVENPVQHMLQKVDKLLKMVNSITFDSIVSLIDHLLASQIDKQATVSGPPEYWLLRQGWHKHVCF